MKVFTYNLPPGLAKDVQLELDYESSPTAARIWLESYASGDSSFPENQLLEPRTVLLIVVSDLPSISKFLTALRLALVEHGPAIIVITAVSVSELIRLGDETERERLDRLLEDGRVVMIDQSLATAQAVAVRLLSLRKGSRYK